MKKRLLPIPLILLIPILLLIVVSAAGIYRFSLSDEEILAKFPSSQQSNDAVIEQIFGLSTPNPWTIEVPESHAFSFISQYDAQTQLATGSYDTGSERGTVSVWSKWMLSVSETDYVSVMSVSNQGSGVFYYLARFHYDQGLKRMVVKENYLLGDRIQVASLNKLGQEIEVRFNKHAQGQTMSDTPSNEQLLRFSVSKAGIVNPIE